MKFKLKNKCKSKQLLHKQRLNNINNYIIKNENAVYYECGYSCDNQLFISIGDESFFITDARYEIEAKTLAIVSSVIITNDLIKEARKVIKKSGIKKINFDPYDFNLATYSNLTKNLNTKFIQKPNFSKTKRIIKSDDELKLLSKAMKIGRNGFKEFKSHLNNNTQKQSEEFLNFKNKEIMSCTGKYDLSFDPIVAVSENAAKPHALPTSRKLKKKDLLLVDAGIKYKRYCSDRTETYINKHNKLQQKVYDIVQKAQDKAISKARSGMKASQIDKLARDVIEKAGYGKYFVHSTGHGIGLDIHEYPNISSRSDIIIEDNMVFTIEPGIYLPDEFGIRIEDSIAMIDGKAIIL
jgi:Xaa-Pro aminopeptidase